MLIALEPAAGFSPENGPRKRWWRNSPRGILAIVMMVTGAAGFVYECILSTVFTFLLGSSVEQWSMTIGIMLAAMGIGGWMQRGLRGPLVGYFIAAELLLVVLGGFSPVLLQWMFAAMPTDFEWIKFLYPALIGLITGLEIPLVMRINERFSKSLSSNIASTWAWDYIGGFVGVVAWILLLRAYVPITHISLMVAASNMFVALLALAFFWKRGLLGKKRAGKVAGLVASLIVVIALIVGFNHVDAWSKMISQQLYDEPIAAQVTTKYQNIVITQGQSVNPQGVNTQLYLNGNKQFASDDEATYHEFLVHPAMSLAASHQHVLVLGGGDGMALRELEKYPDVEDITLVDLDPGMIQLASTNPIMTVLNKSAFSDARVHSNLTDPGLNTGVHNTGAKQDVEMELSDDAMECKQAALAEGSISGNCAKGPPRQKIASVDVFTIDADQFVSKRGGPYDVVIIDLPDPNSVELAKLYGKEFYTKVRQLMSPEAIVVVQATSPYHAKETFLCVMRTMAAAGLNVLPYHENVPSFGDWGWIIGSPTISSDELFQRANHLSEFPVPTRDIAAHNMVRALIFNKEMLVSRLEDVSTLMNPVVLSYYTVEAWRVD